MTEPYGLDPRFERVVLFLCCARPAFWARIGRELDAEACGLPEATLVLAACRSIVQATGGPPVAAVVVLQRLARAVSEGKLSASRVAEVAAMLDQAEEDGIPPEDAVVAELVPVVRRRLEAAAVDTAATEYARRGDLGRAAELIERASRLGQAVATAGFRGGEEGFERIEALRKLGRLPTGILELDMATDGGPLRGQLGVAIGDSGAGKSIFLTHVAMEGVRNNLHVAIATLELSDAQTFARCAANLTGVPISHIEESSAWRTEARARMRALSASGLVGTFHVGDFPPHATTVGQIIEWVGDIEQREGRKVDLVVVDYGDKLFDPRARADNEYVAMRYVFEGMRRDGAVAKDQWWWTASQASRPSKDSGKVLDLRNVADSMHKVRVADRVVTLNPEPNDDQQITYFVAKNRTGPSRRKVGPLPHDFARARMVPLAREILDWGKASTS